MRHIPPPIRDLGRFLAELQFVPQEDRADAVQESWLAFLTGGDPVGAMNSFARRERRWRQRNVLCGQVNPTAVAYG